ncbi:MAG TPA: nuclear transport factor 2 family protein [Thermoleophilaceae bacterium]|jgi:ketosteroid isomerase-like protein
MRAEGLELAQRFSDAIQAREVPDGLFADDCEIENVPTAVTARKYVGSEGFLHWMQELFDAFGEDVTFEQEPLAAEDDWVVGMLRIAGHGSSSGLPLELRWVGVLWFGDGLIRRCAGFASRREAFAAVGRELD